MIERIDIKQFNMTNEKVINTCLLYIELGDNYFLYVGEYYGQQPKGDDHDDHSLGWEDVYFNFRNKIKRDAIVSVDRLYNEKYDNWRIELEANGYPNPLRLYFETEAECEIMYQRLDEFIFGSKKQ